MTAKDFKGQPPALDAPTARGEQTPGESTVAEVCSAPYVLTGCLVCGAFLERVHDQEMQPSGGVMCTTHGSYGSRVYDQGFHESGYLAFVVCDSCLVEYADRFQAAQPVRPRPSVTFSPWRPSSALQGAEQ